MYMFRVREQQCSKDVLVASYGYKSFALGFYVKYIDCSVQ